MQSRFFHRYIWLVNTISSAGHISIEEIDRRWCRSSLNESGETQYPRRTFLRHKEDIAEMFGIEIAYSRATGTYFIANREDMRSGDLRQWLMNNFAVNNAITESQSLRSRILLENIPAGTHFLPTILNAMRDNMALQVTHKRFGATEHSFTLEPYCLRVFKQRWYVYGRPSDHPTERRIYALDRISDIQETREAFRLPTDFDAEAEFRSFFGVFTDKKAEIVRVRVNASGTPFLRSLPLHASQREVLTEERYSEFEFFIAPTFDFVQQLRTFGSQLIVLSPKWLQEDMQQEALLTLQLYQQI